MPGVFLCPQTVRKHGTYRLKCLHCLCERLECHRRTQWRDVSHQRTDTNCVDVKTDPTTGRMTLDTGRATSENGFSMHSRPRIILLRRRGWRRWFHSSPSHLASKSALKCAGDTTNPCPQGTGKTATCRPSFSIPGSHLSNHSSSAIEAAFSWLMFEAQAVANRSCGHTGIISTPESSAIKHQPFADRRLHTSSQSATRSRKTEYRSGALIPVSAANSLSWICFIMCT